LKRGDFGEFFGHLQAGEEWNGGNGFIHSFIQAHLSNNKPCYFQRKISVVGFWKFFLPFEFGAFEYYPVERRRKSTPKEKVTIHYYIK